MKYFLLWNDQSNRMMIDHRTHPGWKVEKKTEADSWLEAKQKFGMELTTLQKEILNAKGNRAEISRRIIRHEQNAGAKLWSPDSRV